MPDLAWMKDTAGRFTAANRAFTAAKGFADRPRDARKDRPDLSPPDLARSYRSDDAELMVLRGTRRIEGQHAHADGGMRLIEPIKTALTDAVATEIASEAKSVFPGPGTEACTDPCQEANDIGVRESPSPDPSTARRCLSCQPSHPSRR